MTPDINTADMWIYGRVNMKHTHIHLHTIAVNQDYGNTTDII